MRQRITLLQHYLHQRANGCQIAVAMRSTLCTTVILHSKPCMSRNYNDFMFARKILTRRYFSIPIFLRRLARRTQPSPGCFAPTYTVQEADGARFLAITLVMQESIPAERLAFSRRITEAPNSKAHSNTRLPQSERMPNRHRRLERCRSSYPSDASNWASAGQAHRPAPSYF